MKEFLKITLISFAVYFFSWFFLDLSGINSLPIQSEDTLPAMFLPITILKEGTLHLDTYYAMLIDKYPHPDDRDYELGLIPFYLRKVGSVHFASAFPIITALLSTIVYAIPVLLGTQITWANIIVLSHMAAAIIVALSGAVLYLLLKKHFSLDEKKSKLLTYIYLFGTVNFAMISQALWQHGTLELMLILGLYFMYEKKIYFSGLFFGLAVLTRPTAGMIWIFMFILLYFRTRENWKTVFNASFLFFLGLLTNFLFFVWYNKTFYLSISNQGYSNQLFTEWLGNFPESFFGIWLSPSKGILIYSPVFIFSLVGLWYVLKKKSEHAIDYILFAGAIFMHTFIMSLWKHWYGGFSFGYRMSSDIIPFLILLLVPFIRSPLFAKYQRLFISSIVISILVQISGMIFFDGIWHSAYDRGFDDTSWLWSFKDSEFMFNVRRVLVKLGILNKACPVCLPGGK